MKIKIFNTHGTKLKEIETDEIFSGEIRNDVVSKILEAKKTMQPFSPSLVAGKQHSASGRIVHRRHVWRSGYGRGMSRVPRKIFTRRGSQFIWAGAEVSSVRGGRRAHPPKTISMINTKKINKKMMMFAMVSGLSATADKKYISSRYSRLSGKEKELSELPFIVESNFTKLKTKELLSILKKILGEKLFSIAIKKKSIRAGKGKFRGRTYKNNAGMLFVTTDKEKLKTGLFEVKNAKNLSINDLARGGLGRLTIYTENAVRELQEKFEKKTK